MDIVYILSKRSEKSGTLHVFGWDSEGEPKFFEFNQEPKDFLFAKNGAADHKLFLTAEHSKAVKQKKKLQRQNLFTDRIFIKKIV